MIEVEFRAYVLKDIKLRPSSVIVSESYRAALDEYVDGVTWKPVRHTPS